jgi:deoxyadenosine/deoxycytidine kinase
MNRIQRRGRDIEKDITYEYIDGLNEIYDIEMKK